MNRLFPAVHRLPRLTILWAAFLLGSLLLGALPTRAEPPIVSEGNPIFPGWYADPEAAIFDHQYWVFPTFSAPYEAQTFMDAFASPDLVHWTKHPRILDTKIIPWAKRAMWAPAVSKKDGKYYFFFAANDIQHDGEVGGLGVAVADGPEGPYRDLLGKPLIDRFYHGAQPIDPFVFTDKDGQAYLIYGGWRHCVIGKLKDDYTGLIPFPDGEPVHEITPEGYVEGPCMFIRDGKYYFMWSEGAWTTSNYNVAYAVGDSPLGPFKRLGTVLVPDPAIGTGAGHHSVLQPSPSRDQWLIVYHRHPAGEKDGNGRVTCVERMNFNPDGTIQPVRVTKEGVGACLLP